MAAASIRNEDRQGDGHRRSGAGNGGDGDGGGDVVERETTLTSAKTAEA